LCDPLSAPARTGKGSLIIISAPSGAGKTTIVNRLLRNVSGLRRSISYTTRKPREGEIDGKDYFFLSQSEFLNKKRRGFFLEWANVFGKFYGTGESWCVEQIEKGYCVILTIDVQGMRKIERKLRKKIRLISIFIMPPSLSVLKERLTRRKTDSPAEIEKRLLISAKEMKARSEYDFTVVNHNVRDSVKRIKKILNSVK